MPLIKARSSSIIDSVDLRGQPTAPTAEQTVNTNQLASTSFVRTAIAELIDSSPDLLNTLNELAAAIANDPNFATTIATSLATKLPKDGSQAMTGELTLSGDPITNLGAVTKQYVDSAINAQMIYSTDDVPEGTTNLYYTDARVRGAWSLFSDNTTVLSYDQTTGILTYNHPTSDGILEGTTNLYFSQSRARQSISLNSDDNTIISYSSQTGEFTFTTPSTDKIVEGLTNQYFTTARARNSVSNGANIDYDSATGVISTQAAVWSVNGQTHDVVLDTDNIDEGSMNLYYTDARARSAVSVTTDNSNILSYSTGTGVITFVTPSTDAISEGAVNLYYTDARVRAAVSASGDISYNDLTGNFSYSTPTTDGVNEGSMNLYFTNARARNAVSLTTDNNSVLSYDPTSGVFTFSLGSQTTDDVAEGRTNLYFTTARARDSISASGWSNLSYNNATGIIAISAPSTDDVTEGATNLYFTTTRAQNSVSATKVSGDGDFTYDNTMGVFSYTGPTSVDYRQAVSALANSGDGNLQYSSITGVFTYDGPTNTNYRQAVSAYKASGDGNLAYDSATGTFTYTGPSAAEVRLHFSAATSGIGFGDLTYDNTTGVFTFAKVTASDVRSNLSAATTGTGHGDLTYDPTTGAYTYAKVTASDVRGDISATSATGVSYDSATGIISLANIPNASLTNSKITVNSHDISLGGSYNLVTDDINEGTMNLYWTQARFDTALAGKTTNDVAEGTNNLYYTQSRFDTAFAAKTTADLAEDPMATATSGTQYFTETRARNTLSGGTGVTYTSSTGVIAIGQDVSTTSNVTFNDVTVSGDLTVLGTMTAIQSTTVEINDLNLTLAKGAASAAQANGAGLTIDGANATFNYVSGADRWETNKGLYVNGDFGTSGSAQFGAIDNTPIGQTTPAAGKFTQLKDTALTAGRVVFAGTDGELSDASGLTFNSMTGTLTATAFTGPLTGDVTGNVTGNLTGNVTGQVSDLSNHTTDDVSEGTTNLYFTDARVRSALSADNSGTGHGTLSYDNTTGKFTFAKVTSADIRGELSATKISGDGNFSYDSATGTYSYTGPDSADYRRAVSANKVSGDGNFAYDSTTGVFSYTGPSDSEVRAHFSAIDAGGDGSFSYDSATGAFTYTGPSDSEVRAHFSAVKASGDGNFAYDSATGIFTYTGPNDSEVRAHFSANTSTGAAYDSATGVFSLANIPNSSLTNSSITILGAPVSLGDSITFSTDDVSEGTTNLYFTDSRARNAVSLVSSNLNTLSYDNTSGVFTFDLAGMTTDDVAEGMINQYFTQARARNSISSSGWSNLSYDSTSGVITISAPSTDDVTEGTTNKYYLDSRARTAISLTTDNTDAMSYDNTTGNFHFTLANINTDEIAEGLTNLYFTTARARASISNGANIDYDPATGIVSTQAAVWSVNGQTHDVVLGTDDVTEGSTNLYFTNTRAQSAITLVTDDSNILSYATGTGTFTFVTPTTDAISEGLTNLYYTDSRADARIAAASIRDLNDVDKVQALQDGYTLVWNSFLGKFVPQNIAVQASSMNFTGDGTTASFSTGVEVTSIDNTQVYINGLIQAPTYSYTINTVSSVTSIVFDTAPEVNDYIFVRVVASNTLSAGGVLNEGSNIDGGTY